MSQADDPAEEARRLRARLAELESHSGADFRLSTAARRQGPSVLAWSVAALLSAAVVAVIAAVTTSGTRPSTGQTGAERAAASEAFAATSDAAAAASDAERAAETSAPSPPAHNWQIMEGGEYGYATALSEEKRMAGQAASEVVMVQYQGEKDGDYTITNVENGLYVTSTCRNPCEVIKTIIYSSWGPPVIKHLTFNPASVIGEAFTDAFNGQLEAYSSIRPDVQIAQIGPVAVNSKPSPIAPVETRPTLSPPPNSRDQQSLPNRSGAPTVSDGLRGPAEVNRLLSQVAAAQIACRQRRGADQGASACLRRDQLEAALNRRGFCRGTPDGPDFQLDWHPCDSTGQPLTPN